MKESGYYPPGAEFDSSAPYNEIPVEEREFDVEVEYVMRKECKVTTDDYVPEIDDENGHEYANTENTDWDAAYENSNNYGIPELLLELEQYIKQDLERYKGSKNKERHLKEMLESCQEWEVIESNIKEI